MYVNKQTENAISYDNLILGDMSDSNGVHFVQLKIDKEQKSAIIFLQLTSTKEILYFQTPIDEAVFTKLYSACDNELDGVELEKKIIELYSAARNLIDCPIEAVKRNTVPTKHSAPDALAIKTSFYAGNTLADVFNEKRKVKIGAYENIISISVFESADWDFAAKKWELIYSLAPCSPFMYLMIASSF